LETNTNLYSPQWVSTEHLPKDLYSEILPGLFMGGTHDDDVIDVQCSKKHLIAKSKFDAVITMYASAKPVDWHVQEIRFGVYDGSMNQIDIKRLMETAYWGYQKWLSGDQVLIRCQAGLNRSGLITALILMLDGLKAEDAIRLIRKNRAEIALINNQFVDWLVHEATDVIQNYAKSGLGYILNNNQNDETKAS
jgi:hypothetical protein